MNYRIYCLRKPVKRVQLLPTDLSSKYPDSLQPSFLLVWCWKILLATETAGLALARWWRRHVQIGHQIINDSLAALGDSGRNKTIRGTVQRMALVGLQEPLGKVLSLSDAPACG